MAIKLYAKFAAGVVAVIVWPFKQVWSGIMRMPAAPVPASGDAEG